MQKELDAINQKLEILDQRLSRNTVETELSVPANRAKELLEISNNTFNDWRRKGYFPVYVIGRKVYVKLSEVQAFLETNVERQDMAA